MQRIKDQFVIFKNINGESRWFRRCKWLEIYDDFLCPDGERRRVWKSIKWLD